MPSTRPIFVATHPRACSTAFERVFMTRRDILECAHEPFGDAFYFGPERLSSRYEADEAARASSGFSGVTYRDVLDGLKSSVPEGKRLFIKDITHYLSPPDGKAATAAPSLARGHASGANGVNGANGVTNGSNGTHTNGAHTNGTHTNGTTNGTNGTAGHKLENPTVLPLEELRKFHFTFLIRHPRRSIPSYYRCTIPPLSEVTGFVDFMPSEAGYLELRWLFDYLRGEGVVGPARAGEDSASDSDSDSDSGSGSDSSPVTITVVDADDLLDKPAAVVEAFCREVGIDYSPDMLRWEDEENQRYAVGAFAKWNGFHDDVINSTYLKPRTHGCKSATTESDNKEWLEKYGEKGQKIIRDCVDANVEHYEYLKSFALKV
ncbi:hypothetical protein RB598_005118 [Gaeumannomyces tritici]